MPTKTQDTPLTTPKALDALSALTRTVMETGRELRNIAARLESAERDLHCARPTPDHRPAGDLSDQFADLRKAIIERLPDSLLRYEALMCLAAAKDKTTHAAMLAATHDSHLQAVHRLPDTQGPEDAA